MERGLYVAAPIMENRAVASDRYHGPAWWERAAREDASTVGAVRGERRQIEWWTVNRASIGFAPGRGVMSTRSVYSPDQLNTKRSL